MKRILRALLVVVMAFGVVFSQEHNENIVPKKIVPGTGSLKTEDPVSSLSNWIRYTSPEGRYSIKFPAEPKLNTQESSSAEGTKFLQYIAASESPSVVCMVGYFDISAETVFSLDKARDGVLQRLKGTLLTESSISLGGNPARELKLTAKAADGTEFLVRARMYVVKQRVFFVQYIVLGSADGPTSATQAAEYFDSFSVAS